MKCINQFPVRMIDSDRMCFGTFPPRARGDVLRCSGYVSSAVALGDLVRLSSTELEQCVSVFKLVVLLKEPRDANRVQCY